MYTSLSITILNGSIVNVVLNTLEVELKDKLSTQQIYIVLNHFLVISDWNYQAEKDNQSFTVTQSLHAPRQDDLDSENVGLIDTISTNGLCERFFYNNY